MSGPLRIERLTLRDYRAFPGPVEARVELTGLNLLVHGENGAGKSSIFHALADFFSLRRRTSLSERRNVFSNEAESDCRVGVRFNDGSEAIWRFDAAGKEEHPGRIHGDARVARAAQRSACLDYRALLDTNYAHGGGSVNLFEIARDRLLAEFPATVSGGITRSIAQLWDEVERAKPARMRTKAALMRVDMACLAFNQGFQQALDALHPKLAKLLPKLIKRDDVVIDPFVFGGVTYERNSRSLTGRELLLRVRYRNHALNTPQHFLNEARLSALGLAIYFAGRLATVPSGPTPELKLLVLDDVLIGLDHENRRPVLKVIQEFFEDWQVVLLTYDLPWFEMAKELLGNTSWRAVEIFERYDAARRIPVPIVRHANEEDAVEKALVRADELVSENYLGEAANRARVAFETLLRQFCEAKRVPLPFKTDARKVDTEDLRAGIMRWAKDCSLMDVLEAPMAEVISYRRWLLNDGSHNASPGDITTADARAALVAIRALRIALKAVKTAPIRPAPLGKEKPAATEEDPLVREQKRLLWALEQRRGNLRRAGRWR